MYSADTARNSRYIGFLILCLTSSKWIEILPVHSNTKLIERILFRFTHTKVRINRFSPNQTIYTSADPVPVYYFFKKELSTRVPNLLITDRDHKILLVHLSSVAVRIHNKASNSPEMHATSPQKHSKLVATIFKKKTSSTTRYL
jgi:hypothetical protein